MDTAYGAPVSATADAPPHEAPAGQEWWYFVSNTDREERINGGRVRWWLQDVGSEGKRSPRVRKFGA